MRDEIVSAETAIVDILDETFRTLAAINFDLLALGGIESQSVSDKPAPTRLIYWLVMEFVILSTPKFIPLFGSLTSCLMYMGVMSLNARRITHDADAAWSFSTMDAPPPDRLRAPVTLREIAEELNLNLLTVRRHVNTLIRSGDLKSVKGGFLVSMQSMQSDRLLSQSPQVAMHFIRLIRELDRIGYALPRNTGEDRPLLSA